MSTQPPQPEEESPPALLMNFDCISPLDELFFSSSSNNHLLMAPPLDLSSPEHSVWSPLWKFSDDDDFCFTGNAISSVAEQDDELVFVIQSPLSSGNKCRLPPPNYGLPPRDNLDPSFMIKDRITQALRCFKESTVQHFLAQVWIPVKNGDQYVLTTSGQPFVVDAHSNGLHQYRMASLMYMFSVDDDSDLPARVFRQKVPEWSPDVRFYSRREYQRLDHAMNYNVRGLLALPVFEHSSMSCVGVIELIMTSHNINYGPEVEKVCKALEAVNLKGLQILDHPNTQPVSSELSILVHPICNKGHQNALAEILKILTIVCETHKLPLAQTWVPCRHRSVLAYGDGFKKSCSSFDGSCMGQVCMSTADVAFYIVDPLMWGFREACVEHHLQKGQGVSGNAFGSRNPCFCKDIRLFSKTEYPLVHYARIFGLTSSFAICLQSNHTGNDDYILEFFLPPDFIGDEDIGTSLNFISVILEEHSQSLKFATGIELEEQEIYRGAVQEYSDGISGGTAKKLATGQTILKPIPRKDGIISSPRRKKIKRNKSVAAVNESLPDGKRGTSATVAFPEFISENPADGEEGQYLGMSCPTTVNSGNNLAAKCALSASNPVVSAQPEASNGGVFTEESLPLESELEFQRAVSTLVTDLQPDNGSFMETECPLDQILAKNIMSTNNLSCGVSAPDVFLGEKMGDSLQKHFQHPVKANAAHIIIIKVAYGNYTIRFPLSSNAGIIELKNAVAKRLKLKVESFNMKYLDDDQELILIACDADLLECFRILKLLGNSAIRLLAQPIAN